MALTSTEEDGGHGGEHERWQSLCMRAIGWVENEFPEQTSLDTIRAAESRIILDRQVAAGARRLAASGQVVVIFYFHRSEGFELHQHPRGDHSRPPRGVFALRSPYRPNPIGVTTVDVLSMEDNVLRVRGLDALDGSPVLDLQPA